MGMLTPITRNGLGHVLSRALRLGQDESHDPVVTEQNEEQADARRDVFSIPKDRLKYVIDKVEKLNRKAVKLGLEPIEIKREGEERVEHRHRDTGQAYYTQNVIIRFHGEAPVLNGWRFVARVLHSEDGNILKTVPGQVVPEEYRESQPFCEHCHKNRRRRDTFIVTNGDEYKQVGSKCLADFLGHPDPRGYAAYAEQMANLHDELEALSGEPDEFGGGGGGGGNGGFLAEDFLAVASAIIRKHGWVSRRKQRDENVLGTADATWLYMVDQKARKEMSDVEVTDEDSQLADDVVQWAKSLRERDDLNDYLWNLSVAVSQPIVTRHMSGLVASAVTAYRRANRVVGDNTNPGEGLVGNEGMPLVVSGILRETKPIGTYRGTSLLHTMEDGNGNVIKWFGTPGGGDDLSELEGQEVKIKGVVKSHQSFRGSPETMLAGVRGLTGDEYEHEMEQMASMAAERERTRAKPKEYKPKDKFLGKLMIVDKKYIDGAYGTSVLHLMVDPMTGQNFKWFSSSADLEVGKTYPIKATVKGEDEFNGQKSVLLTRASVISEEDLAAGGKAKRSGPKLMGSKRKREMEENRDLLMEERGREFSEARARSEREYGVPRDLSYSVLVEDEAEFKRMMERIRASGKEQEAMAMERARASVYPDHRKHLADIDMQMSKIDEALAKDDQIREERRRKRLGLASWIRNNTRIACASHVTSPTSSTASPE